MSRVLVTGGAGYVGSETAHALLEAGFEVTVFDDLSTGHREAVPAAATFVEGSLEDPAAIAAALEGSPCEAVLHFAAKSIVGDSMRDPLTYIGGAVAQLTHLLRAMEAAHVGKLVLSSTAALYGNPDTTPIEESATIRPENPYGEGKHMLERTLAWMAQVSGLRYAALRYFNAAGAHESGARGEDHRPETHLVPLVLQVANGQRDGIALFGTDYPTRDGTCVRDYVHVCDLADAHIAALRALDEHPRLELNLGTGVGSTVREVLACCREVTGHAIPATEAPRREGDPAVLVASAARAHEVLGWTAKRDLHAIVESAWRWHEGHPRGYAS